MVVTKTPPGKKPAVEDLVQVPPEKIKLELSAHGRYVIAGNLFMKKDEQGNPMTYDFTPEQAGKMLRLQSDSGIPVFRRWVEKKNTRLVEVRRPSSIDMTEGQAASADVVAAAKRGERLDIGGDDEISDILSEVPAGEGDLSLDDLGAGVKV